ncbi:MAG: energy transducer TonB [Pseudomonadota bacterium]|nr:energy transducer TonB [Pseudomonadota bacterium]
MRAIAFTLIAGLLAAPLAAQAKDRPTISLPMSAKWEINYDTDSCHLLAQFGQGEDLLIMRMTRFEPGSPFDLMLYGKMFATEKTWVPLRLGFGDTAMVERQAGAGTAGKLAFVIAMHMRVDIAKWPKPVADDEITDGPVTPEAEAKITAITVAMRNGKNYRLETGSLAKPMQALRDCTDNLLTSWGYDPKIQANLGRRVTSIGSPAAWLTTNDYPADALRAGHNGIIQFRLDVDERGKVAGCHVLRRFKPDDFAKLTCDLLTKRAHFEPALDAANKPVKWYYINTVRFVIPDY